MQNWNEFIFSDQPFEIKAQAVFEYQYQNNPVYRRFCDALEIKPASILSDPELVSASDQEIKTQPKFPKRSRNTTFSLHQIPLLPVQAFKDATVFCGNENEVDLKFRSSGTGGMDRAAHWVADKELYRKSVRKAFGQFYDLENAVILGYMPGYAKNKHSSLIWMINELIKHDKFKKSRFLPLDKPLNQGEVDDIAASGKQLILFGAAFGLMDLLEISTVELPSNSIVIETGGMKTHKREISREKMHRILAGGFGVDRSRIHSEYGMCELLSQAYATGGKWFRCPPWMQVAVYNPDNPQSRLPAYKEGLLGIIDLANVYSCSFILTGDRGVMDPQARFQVLGRWRAGDLRGCNFLIDED